MTSGRIQKRGVILHTGKLPTTRQNQFPVFETEAGFLDRGEKKFLHDVLPAGIGIIESEQPFRTGEGMGSPPWHLHELSNVDKHRTLHVIGAMLQAYELPLPALAEGVNVVPLEVRPSGTIDDDAVLWRGLLEGQDKPLLDDKLNATFTVDVAFDGATPAVAGLPVFTTLKAIADRTAKVLNSVITVFQ